MANFENPIADLEKEKFVLSAMLIREGECVPEVVATLNANDFYRPQHRIVFRAITKLYSEDTPPNALSIISELERTNELGDDKVSRTFIWSLTEYANTNAYVPRYIRDIKEKSKQRLLIDACDKIKQNAEKGIESVTNIIASATTDLNAIAAIDDTSKVSDFGDYFNSQIVPALDDMSKYGDRKTGFDNLDKIQFFAPGLYVLGALPAAGKTTFAWQLLEQLAKNGEQCIFCSYEMSALELYTKSIARELLNRNPDVDPLTLYSAAKIRRCHSSNLPCDVIDVMTEFAKSKLPLKVIELRNENVNALLNLLRPLCKDKEKAPVVCIDYLQIIPTDKDITKLGIDDTVRKLKAFQRDTNTTFIVVSSFNRTNYLSSVSFESFKESGSIEYTADVVWGLQLNIMNKINVSAGITKTRQQIDAAKKEVPREIQLRCLKNRTGANYECYFKYFAANDCFVACTEKDFDFDPPFDDRKPAADNNDTDASRGDDAYDYEEDDNYIQI